MSLFQFSTVSSWILRALTFVPALFTRMSIRPERVGHGFDQFGHACRVGHVARLEEHSGGVFGRVVQLGDVPPAMATLAPDPANSRAAAWPTPLPPPVIRTAFPETPDMVEPHSPEPLF
jgi:hypothetical protein